MEANSLPPDPKAPVVYDSNALESTVVDNTPLANLSNAQNYPIEALEVRDESNAAHTPTNQPPPQFSSAGMGSVPFSRKRAATVSLGITIIVMIFTGGIMAVLVKGRLATKEAANRDVPTQGITLESSSTGVNPVELQKDQQSLLVSGDIITRGELQISSGGFVTTLRSQPLTGSQTITLPAESGTICLDSNNCNFVSQSQLAEVQGQIVDATTVNNNSGDITLQGTTNQVSVTTNGQVITFTTPQNLHTAASVQFADLRLSGTLRTDTIRTNTAGGNLAVTADAAQLFFVDRSRTFSFPAGGLASQTICTTQNNCNYGTGNGDIVNGGQIGPIVIGTDDASTLQFETSNTTRIALQSNGNITMDTDTLTVDAVNNRVGIGTAAPTTKLQVSGGSLLVTGTHTGTSEISVAGAGTRMFFDVGKSAFRAGAAGATSWDGANLGLYSAAFGQNTSAGQWGFAAGQSTSAASLAVAFGGLSNASGWLSAAFGQAVTSQGFASTAIGVCNTEQGTTNSRVLTDTVFAIGNGVYDSGSQTCTSRSNALTVLHNGKTTVNGGTLLVQGTHGGGVGNTTTGAGTRMFFDVNKSAFRTGAVTGTQWNDANIGNYSFAGGLDSNASGAASFAYGNNVSAAGSNSAALGAYTRASNPYVFASGFDSGGIGLASQVLGYGLEMQAFAATAIGYCNYTNGSQSTTLFNATEQLFVVGNGTYDGGTSDCSLRQNALEMTKNGNLAVDTNTLYVDAVNNRVGIGTAAPTTKLQVIESSTSTTAGSLTTANITVTDTGNVTTGADETIGLSVSANRTGATGGTIITIGGTFTAVGDVGGASAAIGVRGVGLGTDSFGGVQGLGFIVGSGSYTDAIGVAGATVTYAASGATVTNAFGLQGSVAIDLGIAAITNAAGLNIASATNTAGGTITNNYGVRIQNQTVGASDYGLYIEGADTYALWVDDGVSRLDGNLEVDTDTLFVDATANRVGIGTATPSAKLHVVESSTSAVVDALTGAYIQVTDTGAVNGGLDITAGLAVRASRTGAIDGIFVTNGAQFESDGDTAGNSLVQGINAWARGGDNSNGVNGVATVTGSGTYASIVGVQGSASVYLASDAAVTDAVGLQGSVSNTSSAAYTNGVGLNIKTAVNSGAGSITNNYGLRVENQTAGASNYGLYIEGASTYGIWVDSGVSRFDGNVAINATAASNKLNLNTLTTADAAAQLAVSTDGTGNKGVIVQGVASQTADLFQAQDSTGAVLASISATGDLTVETATINGTLTVNGNATINGHVISGNSSGSTTVAVDTAAGTGAAASIDGNDTAGTITIDTGTAATTGSLVTITFAQSYANAPRVVVTAADSDGSLLGYFVTGVTTTGFTIDVSSAPADTTELLYNYHVIE